MNFYCIDWKSNTETNCNDGIRGHSPIITREGNILNVALDMFGQDAVDNGKVAVFKIGFPEVEQEGFLQFLGMREAEGKEAPEITCYKSKIPPEWIEAAFTVYDYRH